MNFCDSRQACPKSETIWWQEGFHEFRSLETHAQVLFAASVSAELICTSGISAAQCMYHIIELTQIENSVILCILLTMESDCFCNFGPFIFFIILWLFMISSSLLLSSKIISCQRIFLAISFHGIFFNFPHFFLEYFSSF